MSIITSSTLAVVHLPLITVDRQSLFITSSPFVVVVFVFFRLLRESFPRTSKSKGWCHFFPPRIIGSATSSIREKKKTFQSTEVKCYFFTVRKTKLNHANQLTRSGNVSYSPHSTHTYQIAAVFWCTSHNHNRSFTASEISVDHDLLLGSPRRQRFWRRSTNRPISRPWEERYSSNWLLLRAVRLVCRGFWRAAGRWEFLRNRTSAKNPSGVKDELQQFAVPVPRHGHICERYFRHKWLILCTLGKEFSSLAVAGQRRIWYWDGGR